MEKVLLSRTRDKIKTGDLIAFNQRKFNSLVTFVLMIYHRVYGAKYTHVGIATWLGDDLFITEAVPPYSVPTPIESVEDFYWIPCKLETSEVRKRLFLKLSMGKPYSIFEMIKTFLNIKPDRNSLYCSELASRFYLDCGYITDRSAGQTPDTIVQACLNKAGIEEPIHIAVDRGNYV